MQRGNRESTNRLRAPVRRDSGATAAAAAVRASSSSSVPGRRENAGVLGEFFFFSRGWREWGGWLMRYHVGINGFYVA